MNGWNCPRIISVDTQNREDKLKTIITWRESCVHFYKPNQRVLQCNGIILLNPVLWNLSLSHLQRFDCSVLKFSRSAVNKFSKERWSCQCWIVLWSSDDEIQLEEIVQTCWLERHTLMAISDPVRLDEPMEMLANSSGTFWNNHPKELFQLHVISTCLIH